MQPRPDQETALAAVQAALRRRPRAQVHMACGTGKTLVGVWTARDMQAGRVAVLVPSLALVQQMLGVWQAELPGHRLLVVCSDPSTAEGRAELAGASSQVRVQGRTGITVTTDPAVASARLHDDRDLVVVATYHSSAVLGAAVRASGRPLDLLVCDEAHHLAGTLPERFRPALRDRLLPARRRLFMTATPVHVRTDASSEVRDDFDVNGGADQLLSMDDVSLFGEVAHRLPAGEAIECGLLTDYQVLVVAEEEPAAGSLPLGALITATQQFGLRRVLSFHTRVAAAKAFATAAAAADGPIRFDAATVNGASTARQVGQALQLLARPAADRPALVTAAKCLQEGINIPAVDAVLFADPRTSNVDIIQIIGRALRAQPGKNVATIVVPIRLPASGDDDEQLAGSVYGPVWRILRGLRAHDDRVTVDLETAQRRLHSGADIRQVLDAVPWLHIVGDPSRVLTRLVRGSSGVWASAYAAAAELAGQMGGAHNIRPGSASCDGIDVGVWVQLQRELRRRGVLHPARAARLEQIPGWVWTAEAAADRRAVDAMYAYAWVHGSVADNECGTSAFEKVRYSGNHPLSAWLPGIRRAYRAGTVNADLRSRLAELPGWAWEPLEVRDRRGVEAVRSFVAWEGHLDVPAGHLEGDFPLADWLQRIRLVSCAGQLLPALRHELLAVCPTRRGEPVFNWDHAGQLWELGYLGLRSIAAGAGSPAGVHARTVAQVAGAQVNVGQWVARQRWLRKRGELRADLAARLEAVPGWTWSARPAANGEPIDLPAGAKHGTPQAGTYFDCPCLDCVEAARGYAAAWKRNRTKDLQHDWKPDHPAAVNAALLAVDVPSVAIAAAAGAPSSLIRRLLSDSLEPLPPRLARRIRRLTVAEARDWLEEGSRGRTRCINSDPAPADPAASRILVDLAAAGWTAPEIAVALGYSTQKVPYRDDGMTRSQAWAVRCLGADLAGDLTPLLQQLPRAA